jgi:putative ABC transport system permease protein
MFQNYFLLAWRHLLKNRGYSAINIAGLSIGMAIALVIGLWITDEANFDHYAPQHSRLAVGMVNQRLHNAIKKEDFNTDNTIMTPLGKALGTQYKDLFTGVAMADFKSGSRLFNYGDKTVSGIALTAQADLPSMFGFRMLGGNADATKDPSTIIIAQSLATALFGNDDPVGKSVKGRQHPRLSHRRRLYRSAQEYYVQRSSGRSSLGQRCQWRPSRQHGLAGP